ncbi:hypothetical protein E2C01_077547 [Portunus trituberculatus]|uniref:Uncharacterized protein n=1 Tax=Portunus trituberculatus TaxID=210409 RepID=A0A5B7IBN8_PORTR|nr:hypothetical protein [Portunus trituberculatus]
MKEVQEAKELFVHAEGRKVMKEDVKKEKRRTFPVKTQSERNEGERKELKERPPPPPPPPPATPPTPAVIKAEARDSHSCVTQSASHSPTSCSISDPPSASTPPPPHGCVAPGVVAPCPHRWGSVRCAPRGETQWWQAGCSQGGGVFAQVLPPSLLRLLLHDTLAGIFTSIFNQRHEAPAGKGQPSTGHCEITALIITPTRPLSAASLRGKCIEINIYCQD